MNDDDTEFLQIFRFFVKDLEGQLRDGTCTNEYAAGIARSALKKLDGLLADMPRRVRRKHPLTRVRRNLLKIIGRTGIVSSANAPEFHINGGQRLDLTDPLAVQRLIDVIDSLPPGSVKLSFV